MWGYKKVAILQARKFSGPLGLIAPCSLQNCEKLCAAQTTQPVILVMEAWTKTHTNGNVVPGELWLLDIHPWPGPPRHTCPIFSVAGNVSEALVIFTLENPCAAFANGVILWALHIKVDRRSLSCTHTYKMLPKGAIIHNPQGKQCCLLLIYITKWGTLVIVPGVGKMSHPWRLLLLGIWRVDLTRHRLT